MIIELCEERIRRHGEIMAVLRAATRKWQDQLDTTVNLSRLVESKDSYQSLLERMFGFLVPIEFKLEEVDEPSGLSLSARRKSSALLLDLISLGASKTCLDQVPVCEDLPAINSVAQLLGTVYVLEEAVSGGQFLCQLLQQRIGIAPEAGGRFYFGYGSMTRAMWRAYAECLEREVLTDAERDEVIEAAIATYQHLIRWLGREETDRECTLACACLA